VPVSGLEVEPRPEEWALPEAPARSEQRARVGLPEGAAVIMVGHQAEAWHPGIAAKFYLARALADAMSEAGRPAIAAWLTPDHVGAQPFRVRVPVMEGDRLAARALDLAPALPEGASVCAAATTDELRAEWGDLRPAISQVETGVEAQREALERSAGEANAAKQAIAAMERVLGPAGRADVKLYASELAASGAMDGLIAAMREDPGACARAYNEAAAARPQAGIGALFIGSRIELPLWKLGRGRAEKVYADELADLSVDELAPRALTMTLLARRDLCDVFIHGTGGGLYDPVMEEWARGWLGEESLAPMITATATYRLPLDGLTADESEIERAVWRAHAARHDPALLGDDAAAAEKRSLVERIEAARSAGGDAGADFQAMHGLLARVRTERADRLAELDRAAGVALARRGTAGIARDRTWAQALHDESVKEELIAGARRAASAFMSPARSPRG